VIEVYRDTSALSEGAPLYHPPHAKKAYLAAARRTADLALARRKDQPVPLRLCSIYAYCVGIEKTAPPLPSSGSRLYPRELLFPLQEGLFQKMV
jgi:hypothetical protein